MSVQVVPERLQYERMLMVALGNTEGRRPSRAASFDADGQAFGLRVSEADAAWVLAASLDHGSVALPLLGPLSDLRLPPIVPERRASCRFRMVAPPVAWVKGDGSVRDLDGDVPRWRPWRPWLRLDRSIGRELWLNRSANGGTRHGRVRSQSVRLGTCRPTSSAGRVG